VSSSDDKGVFSREGESVWARCHRRCTAALTWADSFSRQVRSTSEQHLMSPSS
jgi:hypothetical protein